jgi:hypothetical protein
MIDLNIITENIIGCAIEVHRTLGPGVQGSDTVLYEDDEQETGSADQFQCPVPQGWDPKDDSLSLCASVADVKDPL